MTILESVEREAAAAHAAVPLLTDDAVASALALAAARLAAEHDRVLAANEADLAAAEANLDEGALDRLRLDPERLTAIEAQLRELADLPPLEREVAAWTLPNGLEVSERRITSGPAMPRPFCRSSSLPINTSMCSHDPADTLRLGRPPHAAHSFAR